VEEIMPKHEDLTCAGSTNWATFNVHVNAWNDPGLYARTMEFVQELEHLADFSDAVEWYTSIIAGNVDKFGHKNGERESEIDFEGLAGDLRAEQDLEYLLDMEYVTPEEIKEAGLTID
jgi:hypothetical protein